MLAIEYRWGVVYGIHCARRFKVIVLLTLLALADSKP